MLRLIKPDIEHRRQYLEMLDDWKASGEVPQPWVLNEDCSDFSAMVQKFESLSKGKGVPDGFVPNTTYWALNAEEDKIVGAVNIRHRLNDLFLASWGHIGYGVCPGERRKGYATEILRLALFECGRLDMEKVLLGCYKDNIASVKTILRNGGILENEVKNRDTGHIIQRYWIPIR